eukprot:gene13887-biopygen1471
MQWHIPRAVLQASTATASPQPSLQIPNAALRALRWGRLRTSPIPSLRCHVRTALRPDSNAALPGGSVVGSTMCPTGITNPFLATIATGRAAQLVGPPPLGRFQCISVNPCASQRIPVNSSEHRSTLAIPSPEFQHPNDRISDFLPNYRPNYPTTNRVTVHARNAEFVTKHRYAEFVTKLRYSNWCADRGTPSVTE